jgi:hypothetical protein
MKLILNIVNDGKYKHVKLYYEIYCIVGYTKIIKSDKFENLKIYVFRSTRLSCLCSSEYRILEQDFCIFVV